MKHRHIDSGDDPFSLVAIDSFITRGRVHWIELKDAADSNPILLLKILHICNAMLSRQNDELFIPERYRYWQQFAHRRLLSTIHAAEWLVAIEEWLDVGIGNAALEKVALKCWERYSNLVKDKIDSGLILTTGFSIAIEMYRENVKKFHDCGDHDHAEVVNEVLEWMESQSKRSTISIPFPDEVSTAQLKGWLEEKEKHQ
jgi:hypothetical protein